MIQSKTLVCPDFRSLLKGGKNQMRTYNHPKRLLVVLILLLLPLLPTPSRADSFNVFVGYSDNLRASGFFPNPWIGAPGVVSNQSGAQTFDAGAVRIDNTGATPITITGFSVSLNNGGSVFTGAQFPSLVIPAGGKGIFTQSVEFNFDTSDFGFLPDGIGIDAGHPVGGCTNPGALTAAQKALCVSNAPVVSFTENGTPVSFTDTGNILDTFGYDFINGSSDGNESINWNSIGGPVNRGGNVPEPATLLLLASGLGGLFVLRYRKQI